MGVKLRTISPKPGFKFKEELDAESLDLRCLYDETENDVVWKKADGSIRTIVGKIFCFVIPNYSILSINIEIFSAPSFLSNQVFFSQFFTI